MKSTRGAVTAVVLIVLALTNIGTVAWYKATASSRNKKVAEAAAQQATAADEKARAAAAEAAIAKQKAVEAAAAAEKVKADFDRERNQRDQIDQNVAGFVEGAKTAVEADPSPSQADLVAIGLLESAQQANGQKLTPQQREFWKKTVAGLIAKNAEAEANIRTLNAKAQADLAALGELRARSQASEQAVIALTAQVKDQNAKLAEVTKETVVLTEKAEKLTYDNKVWAEGGQTWMGRFKAILVLCGIVAGVAAFFWFKTHTLGETLKDAVAYGKHAESVASEGGTSNLKRLEDWWENDTKGLQALKKIASSLRM